MACPNFFCDECLLCCPNVIANDYPEYGFPNVECEECAASYGCVCCDYFNQETEVCEYELLLV